MTHEVRVLRSPRMTVGAARWLLGSLLLVAPAHGDGLALNASDRRLAQRPDLAAKLAATPHAYFRFVSAGFAARTCAAFADVLDSLPEVSLHGDAHVEQYAVTSIGRGLTDFDDCTRGKPVIDLVRFGTSLVLAARQKGWPREEQRAVDEFLHGYRDGLGSGRLQMRTPAVVTRIRARFSWQHAPALRQAHELIDTATLPNGVFADGVARFSQLVRLTRNLPPDFFKVKRIGAFTMGIGSALDEKYLILFEGPTAADQDDLVVEAKQVRDLAGNPCLRTDIGASRVLDGQRTIAYEPFAYAAVVPHGGKHFWLHDWTDDYVETSIAAEIRDPRDLREIAYDAGVQMGRAHAKRSDGTRDEALRRAARQALERHESRVRASVGQMAGALEAAWRAFRDDSAAPASRPASP
jgi:uncharacterized protein (DUF2252 family)